MKKIIGALFSLLFVSTLAQAQILIKQNETTAALRRWPIRMVQSADHSTPSTGLTFSAGDIKISKNGAAEANHAGTVTELASGLYYYEASAGEVDTAGFMTARFSKAGADMFVALLQVQADPLNLAVPTSPVADSVYDRLRRLTEADGTAQAGAASTITLAGTASATDNIYNGNVVSLVGGTGLGQSARIVSYVGSTKVATIEPAWTVQPDNTSKYIITAQGWVKVSGGVNTFDSLLTATNVELAALPGASPSLIDMIRFVYQISRNKLTTTSTQSKTYLTNDSTVLGTATLSDDGTTFTRGKMN